MKMRTHEAAKAASTPTSAIPPQHSGLLPLWESGESDRSLLSSEDWLRSRTSLTPTSIQPSSVGYSLGAMAIGSPSTPMLQRKLAIGQPNDQYEQEADLVADQVMRMPAPRIQRVCPECKEELQRQPMAEEEEKEEETLQTKPLAETITPLIQRQMEPTEEEKKEDEETLQTKPLAGSINPPIQRQMKPTEEEKKKKEEETLQTKPLAGSINPLIQRQTEPAEEEKKEEEETLQTKPASGEASTVSPALQNQITALQGGGQPLPESERHFFEPRFGTDFSQVRVHADGQAAEAARAVNARAFTLGRDVVFGTGEYKPRSNEGQRLLAHELTHVVQQALGANVPNQRSFDSGTERNKELTRPKLLSNLPTEQTQLIRYKPRNLKTKQKPPKARQKKVDQPSSKNRCKEPIKHAKTIQQYIVFLRQAEQKLIQAGVTDPNIRIKIFSEIYYGTSWSRDYQVEKSDVRNLGFQIYTRRSWEFPRQSSDPRDCLGCGLFLSLRESGDVGGIDIGHLLIGLNARASSVAREGPIVPVPGLTTSGLENVTWIGDLGGAAARVAMDKVSNPRAGVARYFRGRDYGAPSNLEGDIAAYVVASGTEMATKPTDLVLPPSGLIADALQIYFVAKGTQKKNSYKQFLIMQGGEFKNETFTNRDVVEVNLAQKIFSFGQQYMIIFLRQRERLSRNLVTKSIEHLPQASLEVSKEFVGWLLKRGQLKG
jgi:hypothetical protein